MLGTESGSTVKQSMEDLRNRMGSLRAAGTEEVREGEKTGRQPLEPASDVASKLPETAPMPDIPEAAHEDRLPDVEMMPAEMAQTPAQTSADAPAAEPMRPGKTVLAGGSQGYAQQSLLSHVRHTT